MNQIPADIEYKELGLMLEEIQQRRLERRQATEQQQQQVQPQQEDTQGQTCLSHQRLGDKPETKLKIEWCKDQGLSMQEFRARRPMPRKRKLHQSTAVQNTSTAEKKNGDNANVIAPTKSTESMTFSNNSCNAAFTADSSISSASTATTTTAPKDERNHNADSDAANFKEDWRQNVNSEQTSEYISSSIQKKKCQHDEQIGQHQREDREGQVASQQQQGQRPQQEYVLHTPHATQAIVVTDNTILSESKKQLFHPHLDIENADTAATITMMDPVTAVPIMDPDQELTSNASQQRPETTEELIERLLRQDNNTDASYVVAEPFEHENYQGDQIQRLQESIMELRQRLVQQDEHVRTLQMALQQVSSTDTSSFDGKHKSKENHYHAMPWAKSPNRRRSPYCRLLIVGGMVVIIAGIVVPLIIFLERDSTENSMEMGSTTSFRPTVAPSFYDVSTSSPTTLDNSPTNFPTRHFTETPTRFPVPPPLPYIPPPLPYIPPTPPPQSSLPDYPGYPYPGTSPTVSPFPTPSPTDYDGATLSPTDFGLSASDDTPVNPSSTDAPESFAPTLAPSLYQSTVIESSAPTLRTATIPPTQSPWLNDDDDDDDESDDDDVRFHNDETEPDSFSFLLGVLVTVGAVVLLAVGVVQRRIILSRNTKNKVEAGTDGEVVVDAVDDEEDPRPTKQSQERLQETLQACLADRAATANQLQYLLEKTSAGTKRKRANAKDQKK